MRLRSLAVAVLCLTATVAAAPVAVAAPIDDSYKTPTRAGAAAGWLARQLVDGERFEVDSGGTKFPSQGLTIDAIFAFASAGVSGTYGVGRRYPAVR